jgi:3',5'-cyclic AMP phosphodiesterase CpdA
LEIALTTAMRLAVLSDVHLSPAATPDGTWNNTLRRSVSPQLLQAALAEIMQAGHRRILLLGDISDDGTPEMIGAALSAIANAGLECWAVPGNHDAALDSRALDVAAEQISGCQVVHHEPLRLGDCVTVAGPGLRSSDGGQTCEATSLPGVSAVASQILLWAGHYPLLSQEETLLAAGLRYPGDLMNLRQARGAAEQHAGPILVLHGHLHTAVTQREGRILQLGFPALVEWPHAWTDLRIETSPGGTIVRTAIRPVAGNWSRCGRNTLLAAPAQAWRLTGEGWSAVSAPAGAG